MEPDTLKEKTFFSVIWMVIKVGWSSIATLAIFAILARILDPHAFGIYALATVFSEVTKIIAAGGLSDAIVREKTVDDDLADTVFWANLAFGTSAGLILVLLSAPYAAAIGQPEVTPVLRCLGLLIPLSSLGSIHMARKLRDFGHKVVTLRVIASTLLGGGAAIVSAYNGMGVWSLVIQAGLSNILTVAFAWQSYRWRPRFRFSWFRLRAVLGFSMSAMITQVLWLLIVRVQDIFIGRALGAAAVGNYRLAWRMMELIGQAIAQPMGSVALITFSHLQDNQRRFEAAYRRMAGLASLLTFPLIFGYGLLSTEIIRMLFGSKWGDSGMPAHVLALLAIPFTLNYFSGPAIAAKGASKATLLVAIVQVTLTAGLSFLAAPFGLVVVAGAYVARSYLVMPLQQYMLHKHTGIHLLKSVGVVWPPLVASLCMVGVLAVTRPLLHEWFTTNTAFVIVSVVLGAAVYSAGLLLFGRAVLVSHAGALSPMLAPLKNWWRVT